jgi:hypothetical protein
MDYLPHAAGACADVLMANVLFCSQAAENLFNAPQGVAPGHMIKYMSADARPATTQVILAAYAVMMKYPQTRRLPAFTASTLFILSCDRDYGLGSRHVWVLCQALIEFVACWLGPVCQSATKTLLPLSRQCVHIPESSCQCVHIPESERVDKVSLSF